MTTIQNILFPVDFSQSCVAMAALAKRSAAIFGARVTLLHVFDLYSHDSMQLYVRPPSEVAEEQRNLARDKLDSFLKSELPPSESPRVLLSGDAATQITRLARKDKFDLIIMPTHAGFFRRNLLGSTTAKVLNDADCPVLTTQHVETISTRHLEHREWVCAIGSDTDAERVLRYASQTAEAVHANLTLVHVIPASGPDPVTEEARRLRADVLVIGRSPHSGALGRLGDLSYALARDAPCPVLSV
jgi:nucleotide-binding universal stress UspA family protein